MGFLSARIYPLVPVWLQNLGVSLYGLKWMYRRYGGIFKTEYKGFKAREQFSEAQWLDYQQTQLRTMLLHAYRHVPYYRELLTKAGLDEASLSTFTLDQMHRIPFLEKNTLRTLGSTTLLADKRESGGEYFGSSGSTGTPTQILYSRSLQQRYAAAHESRCRNWAGIDRYHSRGMIGGRRVVPEGDSKGPFYRYNIFEKQVYFSAYHISPRNIGNYAEAIRHYKLDYMTGYAMGNYLLAKQFQEAGIKVPQLKCVITSSEKLTDEMRKVFQEVYGCHTFDGYSGVEACGMITECGQGKLHISPDVGLMEIVNEQGQPCKPGETGEVISTGFLNYDQPLIRYRIGDLVTLSANQQCACGRQMPIIDEIVGRSEDTVVGKDGREMVRFHGIFIGIPGIIEGQIVQLTLDDFEINLVSSTPLTSSEKQLIQKRMDSQLGNVHVTINELESIPRNANGKFKAVISLLKK